MQLGPVCRNHSPDLSAFMTCRRVCDNSSTTGADDGAGADCPSEAPCWPPNLRRICVVQSLIFSVVFADHWLSFCPFQFPASDYPFGILKLFWRHNAFIACSTSQSLVKHACICMHHVVHHFILTFKYKCDNRCFVLAFYDKKA